MAPKRKKAEEEEATGAAAPAPAASPAAARPEAEAEADDAKLEIAAKPGSSKYAGVVWHKTTSKWQASYMSKYIGRYPTELEAARRRRAHVQEHGDAAAVAKEGGADADGAPPAAKRRLGGKTAPGAAAGVAPSDAWQAIGAALPAFDAFAFGSNAEVPKAGATCIRQAAGAPAPTAAAAPAAQESPAPATPGEGGSDNEVSETELLAACRRVEAAASAVAPPAQPPLPPPPEKPEEETPPRLPQASAAATTPPPPPAPLAAKHAKALRAVAGSGGADSFHRALDSLNSLAFAGEVPIPAEC